MDDKPQGIMQKSEPDPSANVMVIDAESTKIFEGHYNPHTLVSQIVNDAFIFFGRTRDNELIELEGTVLTSTHLSMELADLRHEIGITGHLTTITVAKGTSGA